jgi:predicted DNA-binding transcriptional regulator YafY
VTGTRGGRLGRRLNRILLMLPYAIRHPGVTVDELAERFGVTRRDLIADLNLVFLCGLPGYGPGDLIDVDLEGDRVEVRMADYFSAPLRLTPAEALILHAGGAAISKLPGMEKADALQRALEKLERAIAGAGRDGAGEVEVALEGGTLAHMDRLRSALEAGRRIDVEYMSASRGELTRRKIDPWALVAALGRWYLVGWDHLSEEERLFRVDRIKTTVVLDEPATVPEDLDTSKYRGAFAGEGGDATVTFDISPQTATWFEDYYPVIQARDLRGGWRRIELYSSGDRWAATLALRLGSDARNFKPQSVVEEARRLARAMAARHS